MGRNRSQALVVRGELILMVEHCMDGRYFYCLPGGGIEDGETPAEAALRELEEETCIKGRLVQEINCFTKGPEKGNGKVYTFLIEVDGDAIPGKGCDPELSQGEQTITGSKWVRLEELGELDRIYLWASGLKAVPEFYQRLQGMKK